MRCRVELGKEDIPPLMRSNEVWGYVGHPYRRKPRFVVDVICRVHTADGSTSDVTTKMLYNSERDCVGKLRHLKICMFLFAP